MPTKEQILEYKKRYRIKNKEKIREYNRTHKSNNKLRARRTTLRKYGITLEQYQEILDQQNGKCAICNKLESDSNQAFCVDHDHKTNKIRGLLCSKCNRGIGYLNDDITSLQNAINYLQKDK